MLSEIKQTLSSAFEGDSAGSTTAHAHRSSDETGQLLHQCPDCRVVYLSEQPHECSNCQRQTVSINCDGDRDPEIIDE